MNGISTVQVVSWVKMHPSSQQKQLGGFLFLCLYYLLSSLEELRPRGPDIDVVIVIVIEGVFEVKGGC